jgi:hypothetical protein
MIQKIKCILALWGSYKLVIVDRTLDTIDYRIIVPSGEDYTLVGNASKNASYLPDRKAYVSNNYISQKERLISLRTYLMRVFKCFAEDPENYPWGASPSLIYTTISSPWKPNPEWTYLKDHVDGIKGLMMAVYNGELCGLEKDRT